MSDLEVQNGSTTDRQTHDARLQQGKFETTMNKEMRTNNPSFFKRKSLQHNKLLVKEQRNWQKSR